MVPRHRNHWMDHLPGGVVHGDPVLLRKLQTCLYATRPNAVTPSVCDLFLLSPLKSAIAAPPLSQQHRWSCSQQTSSICLLSFILIFIFSFILPSPPPRPFLPLIPIHRTVYCLIAFVLVTTPLHSLVQTGHLRNGQTSRISLHPHLYLTSWTSSGYLSPGIVSLCLSLL